MQEVKYQDQNAIELEISIADYFSLFFKKIKYGVSINDLLLVYYIHSRKVA